MSLVVVVKRARWLLFAVVLCQCTSPFQPFSGIDAGAPQTYNRCSNGLVECGSVCCPSGTSCVSGECQYPYSSAHLYVYLCPSFDSGNCETSFFALDQTCSPLASPQPGTCFDTGFELAARHTYAFAGCTACGSGCSNPVELRTPNGFLTPKYNSGIAWYCGTPCTAPSDCGGAPDPTSGLARCTTADCWLDALRLREAGSELPLLTISQPSPPRLAATSGSPSITSFNSASVTASQTTFSLNVSSQQGGEVDIELDFDDPTGCTPGVCFSMPACPMNQRCTTGTKTLCTRAKHDGAVSGSMIRTLGFRAEPADSTTTEVPLQVQLIAGPADPNTGSCSDPIDESDPSHPSFVSGVLVGAPLQLTVDIAGSDSTPPPADAGAPDAATDAGARDAAASDAATNGSNDVCCCDFRTTDDMWHCTHSSRAGALCAVPWPDCCSMQYTVCE